jgi:(p)ppGpp synthase/HD superfamily hydrolase
LARPTFKPTKKQRRQVAVAAGSGLSHEEIALGLEISRNTLEKHFEKELSTGAYKMKLETLDALHRAAKKGNVAAIKAYNAMTPRAAAPPQQPAKPAKPTGKKEQQQADAQSAQLGTEWNDLLPRTPSSLQ